MVSHIFEAHEKLGVLPFKTHPGWSISIQKERFFDVKTRPQPRTEVAEQGLTRTARDFHGGGGLLGTGLARMQVWVKIERFGDLQIVVFYN